MDGDGVGGRGSHLGPGNLPTIHRRGPRDDPYGSRSIEYTRGKTDRCKRLERWALRLQEFRFAIKPRPGAQQKQVDALSRPPIPMQPDQQPIALDELPDLVAVLVRSWDERVVAWPPGEDRQGPAVNAARVSLCYASRP